MKISSKQDAFTLRMFRTVCSSSQAAGPSQTTATSSSSSSSSSARTFRKLSQHSRHRFHRHKQNDFSVVVTSSSSSVEEDYQRINRREVTLSALLSTALAFVTGTASTKEAFAADAVAKNSLTEEEIYDLQSVAADAYNRQDFTKAREAFRPVCFVIIKEVKIHIYIVWLL